MTVVRISSAVIATAALLLLALTSAAQADHPPPNQGVQDTPLVVVGREPVAATWIGGDSAAGLRFRTAAGDELLVTSDLVRWGYPAASRASAEVHLADGSRLALAESAVPPVNLACNRWPQVRETRQLPET